jgi:hypothetical protein
MVSTCPSEKLVSWDDDIPNIWKNKNCSKPPTRIEQCFGGFSQIATLTRNK